MIKLSSIKPGKLIRFSLLSLKRPLRFCPVVNSRRRIRNDLFWEGRELMVPETILLFVESLDYSKKTTVLEAHKEAGYAAALSTEVPVPAGTWKKARDEFEATKKIPGGIFLNPVGKLIWISHYDLEYFIEKTEEDSWDDVKKKKGKSNV